MASSKPFAWQKGFGAFSVSRSNVDAVARYIRDQEQHHRKFDFKTEFVSLLDKKWRGVRRSVFVVLICHRLRRFGTFEWPIPTVRTVGYKYAVGFADLETDRIFGRPTVNRRRR